MLGSKPSETHREPWQLYAVFFSALAAVLGAVVASKDVLPSYLFLSLVTAISFVVVLVVGYGIIGRRISASIGRRIVKKRKDIRARQSLGEFKDLVDEFWRLSWNNLPNAIQNLPNVPQTQLFKRFNEKQQTAFADPFRILLDNLNNIPLQGLQKWDLVQLIQRFETAMAVYSSFYTWAYVQAWIMLAEGATVPNSSKNQYNQFREEYNNFVTRYNAFANKWNREIEERIFNASIEKAQALP
jgi:hypothetical protein